MEKILIPILAGSVILIIVIGYLAIMKGFIKDWSNIPKEDRVGRIFATTCLSIFILFIVVLLMGLILNCFKY